LSGQPDNINNQDAVYTDWPEHGLWIDTEVTYGDNLIENSYSSLIYLKKL